MSLRKLESDEKRLAAAPAASNSVVYLRNCPYAALMTRFTAGGIGQDDSDQPQQLIDAERLIQEQDWPGWKPAHRDASLEVPAGDDRRQGDLRGSEHAQELHRTQVRKVHVSHETTWIAAPIAIEELPPRTELRDGMTGCP